MVPSRHTFLLDAQHAGKRLDVVLQELVSPKLSRKTLALLFHRGAVRVNGKPGKKGDPASVGALVSIDLQHLPGHVRPAPHLPLEIVYQNADMVIADKPAGLPSAAAVDREDETLAGALLARFPQMANVGFGPSDAGLIHRLDTYTSGLVIAAKTPSAFRFLRQQLEAGHIQKGYLAITRDVPPEKGSIVAPLGPDPKAPQKVRVLAPDCAPPRRTRYFTQERRGGWALVEVWMQRGYRHQIRAHLASLQRPLVGDLRYGGEDLGLSPRHALHAHYVAGTGLDGTKFEATSSLPEDLRTFWEGLAPDPP